jgi:hypothetical protein
MSTRLHPLYGQITNEYEKFRLAYEGGEDFKTEYLYYFSTRESQEEFNARSEVTYVPSHAKAAITEIKNAIFGRLVDIVRLDGSANYNKAVNGLNGGVNNRGDSMSSYIGKYILPELLVQGRVGIYVDRAAETPTTLANKRQPPYLYHFKATDILNWSYTFDNKLKSVLLRRTTNEEDEYGLLGADVETYRLCVLTDAGVKITDYAPDGSSIAAEYTLPLKDIPFVILNLSQPLMRDIADYQIAMLNIASSDIGYLLKANFPFYTEQRDALADLAAGRVGATGTEAGTAGEQAVEVSPTQGRSYAKGLERPSFIHPSTDPIKASMDKQEQLKSEIRQLVALAVTNLEPQRQSAASKEKDKQGLEAGLSVIGLELEYAENQISKFWHAYELEESATIKYPSNYSTRTDADRRAEADELLKQAPKVPSLTYQKTLAKQAAKLTANTDPVTLDTIYKEIDAAVVVSIDYEIIKSDHEAGLVSTETASKARLYPEGEVEQAKKDHAERAMRIAAAQSSVRLADTSQSARGVDDLGGDDADDEKEYSQDASMQDDGAKAVRGKAKGGAK